MRKQMLRWLLIGALGISAGQILAAPARESVLIIVPARPRLVQLAFDLAHLRNNISVVSTRNGVAPDEPMFFGWTGRRWRYIDPQAFHDQQFMDGAPDYTVLVGEPGMLPAAVDAVSAWSGQVLRLPSIQTADLINSMDGILDFTRREWKWLAARHSLELTDINEPRRRFNPYDVPRSQMPLDYRRLRSEPGADLPPARLEMPAPEKSVEAQD